MGFKSFAQINAEAEELQRTHYERQADITRAHFERNPICRRIILKMDEDGNVIRGRGEINFEARCRPGWFSERMWRQSRDEQRPIEGLHSSPVKGIPYRVVAEMTPKEQHLPDRDYGLVDLPRWLQQRYLPVLKALYPSKPVPVLPAVSPVPTQTLMTGML